MSNGNSRTNVAAASASYGSGQWLARLLVERPMGLADVRFALVLVERLPQCRAALHLLARRRWVGRTRRGFG
jgi:hypothetical protein